MGMSASQAKLLSLTGRLHDIEYKAQNIQSQKVALATQKNELYQAYCDALDATCIKTAVLSNDGKQTYLNANFSTLCSYNANRCVDYALFNNNNGKMIVSENVKNIYDKYGFTDKYAFALAMLNMEKGLSKVDNENILSQLGINNCNGFDYVEYGLLDKKCLGEKDDNGYRNDLYMTDVEYEAFAQHYESSAELQNAYNNLINAKETSTQIEAYREFRDVLYVVCGEDIYNSANDIVKSDNSWADIKSEFNYYVSLWEAINQAGGCEAIEKSKESGEAGDEWFNNMTKAGLISIKYFDKKDKKEWVETSVATSINKNFLKEEQDETDLKKAEAAYEYGLDLINQKDTKFDTELKKLETERSAITTEMESIEKVKQENIERTFKIFS